MSDRRFYQRVTIERSDARLLFTTPWAHLPTALSCAGVFVVGLALAFSGDAVWTVMGLAMLVFAVFLFRELRRAGVSITAEQIVERGDLVRKRWPTSEVKRFFVDKAPHIVPWQSLWIELRDGRTRALEQVRVFGVEDNAGREQLEDAAREANEYLDAHGSA
ncbi:MAG: hypothetical protein Q8K63_10075 [Acidimicrobiales bacterium]|nr:hypothetical protein [Acidimicrobiales bacterium]